jgi:hypothetical protein
MSLHYLYRHCKLITLGLLIIQCSCKKFVQINPPTTQITGQTVYSNNTSAEAVMTGLYDNMVASTGLTSGGNSIGFFMGLAADELTNYAPRSITQVQFYENALTSYSNNASNYYFWTELYADIYVTNAVLAGLATSTGIADSVKRQISGEAEFMRAFLNLYATNLYGDVPMVTTTNYLTNNTISRTPQAEVYSQIISDLKDAQSKLSSQFVDQTGASTVDRIRPNQGTATALLARVYLYTGKWDSATLEATEVINNAQYSLDSLNSVFLANSTEAIWQIPPTSPGFNTWDAYTYILLGVPTDAALSPYLVGAFEANDERVSAWVAAFTIDSITFYYYPYKYKVWQRDQPVTEYTMMLRLAEQYLIRAEAEAQQGNLTSASGDLNTIRNRAALPNIADSIATSQTALLSAILHERQVELFSEWGHRWFDLSRTNNLNSVMGAPGNMCQAKGGTWKPDWALLPIAQGELQINPNLKQNPGYSN